MNALQSLHEVSRYIDSFSKPEGYNPYAWNVTKKLALEIWDSYLQRQPNRRKINYLCKEFYAMIRRPDNGEFIVPRGSFRMYDSQ